MLDNVVSDVVNDVFLGSYPTDRLEASLTSNVDKDDDVFVECINLLKALPWFIFIV